MTLHFPDISAYQAGISLAGAPAVAIKATEGTGWRNPDYLPALARAHAAGAFAIAYHFLAEGDTARQAAYCHGIVHSTPLMLDAEPSGSSRPLLADVTEFIDAYRALGGIVNLCYLPRWYWAQLGSPGLSGLAMRGIALWSSAYTTYTDAADGQGWMPYGGITPSIWQYTDSQPFNGQRVDFNAYRGTVGGLAALAGGGVTPDPSPPAPPFPYPVDNYLGQPSPDPRCHSGYYGGPDNINVSAWQARMARRGWPVTIDGQYGPVSAAVCRSFQAEKHLIADGLVGPVTWSATWTAPVT
jgi:peptidoglycan hydrolase-like protein with peptidoglycan-binding domain